eukprot:CAMPEP_0172534590 /NCGR_PEP_ID=MMETSP1067-20121228/6898_1 /TAXON_ID=265564 ORGANISM="Thalassiosira punctigera, Strain Tpunct2005C2" /NCGR_SAMPLE_ID=MMETSP1067 /ASSEMBLY_ACC=CAM_ASM_000444 /LENGTH=274 /DNA_ID=CAMNT_0013319401 /DNA_START=25 /DNA_END=846 /DNA_ORIENTATION=+
MASESTPLVSKMGPDPLSKISGSTPTVYFLDGANRGDSRNTSSHGANSFATPTGHEEIDSMPAGGVAAEFDSRPVSSGRRDDSRPPPGPLGATTRRRHMREKSVGGGWLDYVPDAWKAKSSSSSTAAAAFAPGSGGERKDGDINAGGVGTLVIPRKVPVKVEPKVHFANERTFLAWLHVVLVLAAGSLTIVTFSRDDEQRWVSQLYGIVLLPVSVAYIFYALWQYLRRATMIKQHLPGPYIDVAGPTTLTVILIVSMTAQFCLKLRAILHDEEW